MLDQKLLLSFRVVHGRLAAPLPDDLRQWFTPEIFKIYENAASVLPFISQRPLEASSLFRGLVCRARNRVVCPARGGWRQDVEWSRQRELGKCE